MSDNAQENTVVEPTTEETLASLIADEEIVVLSGNGSTSRNPVSALLSAAQKIADTSAVAVSSSAAAASAAVGRLAADVIGLRSHVILADGLPDWNGSSKTYKLAASLVIDASRAPGEERSTAANRLQKRVVRSLRSAVVDYVVRKDNVTLTADQRAKILAADYNSRGEKDPVLRDVVAAVNAQFRASDNGSAFAPKPKPNRATGTDERTEAETDRDTVADFAQSVPTVPIGDSVHAILNGLRVLAALLSGGDVRYGDRGKGYVLDQLHAVQVLAGLIGKRTADQVLTGPETVLLARLLGEPVQTETETETVQETAPETETAPKPKPKSKSKSKSTRKSTRK